MVAVTVAQATATKTQTSILAEMYADAETLGVDVVGVQAERMFRALFELESRAKRAEVDIRVAVALSGFLDTSAGPWLTLLAKGVFTLDRGPATRAIRGIAIAATAAAIGGTVSAKQMLVQTVVNSKASRWRNVNDFIIVPGSTVGPFLFEAVDLGSAGNFPEGASFTLVSTLAGVTAIDAGFKAGTGTQFGVDEESDATLRKRCRAQWPATSLWGTRLAFARYIQEAFDAAGVTNTITRFALDDTNPNGPGSYDIYLANVLGPATAEEVAIVQAYFDTIEKSGSGPVRVFAAIAKNITLSVQLKGSTDTATATTLLTNMLSTVSLGGIVYYSEIGGTLQPTPGGQGEAMPGLYDIIISAPLANVQLAIFEVPVWSPLSITGGP